MPNTLGNRHASSRGALPLTGGTITGNLTVSGNFNADTVTVSGGIVAGGAVVAAGANISGNANFGGNVGISGNLTVRSLNEGPLAGFRNLLINGNPVINQRGYVSGTAVTSNNQYTLDRWRVATSGEALSWTEVSGIRTVTAPNRGVVQVVESGNNLGGIHTLSWTGTARATVNTIPVAAGSSVSIPPGTNITVLFSGGTFSLPQLEFGPVATPFERRPITTEITLCKRYFEIVYVAAAGTAAAGSAIAGSPAVYQVEKRVAPTSATLVSGYNTSNAAAGTNDFFTVNGHRFFATSNAAGNFTIAATYSVSSEI